MVLNQSRMVLHFLLPAIGLRLAISLGSSQCDVMASRRELFFPKMRPGTWEAGGGGNGSSSFVEYDLAQGRSSRNCEQP